MPAEGAGFSPSCLFMAGSLLAVFTAMFAVLLLPLHVASMTDSFHLVELPSDGLELGVSPCLSILSRIVPLAGRCGRSRWKGREDPTEIHHISFLLVFIAVY